MNASTTRILFALCALAWVVIVARAYLNVKGPGDFLSVVPQSDVQSLAREELNALQQRSFVGDLELCGFIFETKDGELGATRPRVGDQASCNIAYFDEPGMLPVASFHTHGKHSDQYDGEVPSTIDLRSDIASGMDGYVATPGGRFWHIDHQSATARLVCGEGCLDQDPNYVPCPGDQIAPSYTLMELEQRFSTMRARC